MELTHYFGLRAVLTDSLAHTRKTSTDFRRACSRDFAVVSNFSPDTTSPATQCQKVSGTPT